MKSSNKLGGMTLGLVMGQDLKGQEGWALVWADFGMDKMDPKKGLDRIGLALKRAGLGLKWHGYTRTHGGRTCPRRRVPAWCIDAICEATLRWKQGREVAGIVE